MIENLHESMWCMVVLHPFAGRWIIFQVFQAFFIDLKGMKELIWQFHDFWSYIMQLCNRPYH